MSIRTATSAFAVLAVALCSLAQADFQLQEATIDDIHAAIRSGETTCKQVVQGYIARAKTYNVAACSRLVTADGAKVPKLLGATRTSAPVKFPTDTVAISKIVPDFDKYTGLTPDFGRMETTMSDPERVPAVRHGRRHPAMPGKSTRSKSSTSAASARSPARARSMRRRARRCQPARPRPARSSASSPTRSKPRRRSTRSTAAIPISTRCRCTAWRWPTRASTTPRTCAPRAAPT